ncbi:zinc finger protein 385D isoform X2 [Oryzias melastigma]|uniref:zinc finger protein 385D isoform X2 n=1 Tax=Oryzias melastigma TaxID=30732 RepID=UPI000CF81449|nr:zinc finger protein 385D isoform X2 [Oryzias melastigma]
MESSMFFGNTCPSGLMPALVRPTLPAVQSSLAMKQFLPMPLDTASAVSLFPGFSAMDPVQKAVLHHTLGLPPTVKRKHVSCSVCQLRFNSQSQALAHYKGTKHAKRLKALETPKSKLKGSAITKETTSPEISKGISTSQIPNGVHKKDAICARPASPAERPAPPAPPAPPSPSAASSPSDQSVTAAPETSPAAAGDEKPPPKLGSPSEPDADHEAEPETDAETEEEKARRLLYCSLCKVAVNSASQLEAHNSGTKHKTMLEARSGVGSIKSFPRAGLKSKLASSSKSSTGLQNKTFYCETCDVHVNSETQLKQHISSRRHKDRAAGKPAKPKYSPYSKPQKGQSKQPIKLILGKERPCRPLTAQIIPAQLAAVAAAAAAALGNSFAQRTNPASNPTSGPGLFQTQTLPAALLRPAPGPVRTSHPPVLFAPY